MRILGDNEMADWGASWDSIVETIAYSTKRNIEPMINQMIPKGKMVVTLLFNLGLSFIIGGPNGQITTKINAILGIRYWF
jgi:hypothetical protein